MTNTPMTKEALEQEYAKYFNSLDDVYQNDLELNKILHQWNYKGFKAGYEASQAQQEQVIAELVEALEDAQESLGRFTSDEGSTQKDFDTCDHVHSVLAKVKGK